MAAAGIDVVCGIAMYSIFEAIAISQAADLTGAPAEGPWPIVRGPMSIPLGFLAASIGGLIMGCTAVSCLGAGRHWVE